MKWDNAHQEITMGEVAIVLGYFEPTKPGQLVPIAAQRKAKRRLLSAERQFGEVFVMGNLGEAKWTTPALLRQAFPSLRLEHDELRQLRYLIEQLSDEVETLREALQLAVDIRDLGGGHRT